MFKKIKIRTKLLTGFVTVALISAIIGLAGISQLKKIDEADTALFETVTMPLGYATEIASYFQRIRVNIRELVFSSDTEQQKQFLTRIAELEALWNEALTKYEATLT